MLVVLCSIVPALMSVTLTLFQSESLVAEVKSLKESGAGGHFQTMPLPQGMAVTSADVINSLNEHLVHTLQVT